MAGCDPIDVDCTRRQDFNVSFKESYLTIDRYIGYNLFF